MGMFVRENQNVCFPGRIYPSPFTDEYPLPAVFAVLCGFATWREAKSFRVFNPASGYRGYNPLPQNIRDQLLAIGKPETEDTARKTDDIDAESYFYTKMIP
jgi:hypothetical protein